MNNENEFNDEIISEEELMKMIECMRLAFREQYNSKDTHTSIIDPYKMKAIAYTYKIMKYLTKGTNAEVKYELHEPFFGVGAVTVVGSPITLANPEWLAKAAGLASNLEIYPKTDGTVQMNFAFHGLARTIE